MVSINEPEILPLDFGDLLHQPTWLHATSIATHDGNQLDLDQYGIDYLTSTTLHEVQRISRHYTASAHYSSPQEAICVLTQLCSILERLLQLGQMTSDQLTMPGLAQSCRLAAALHIFMPLSGFFPSPYLMIAGLVRDLKLSLTRLIQTGRAPPDLLLWLLAVGGVSSHSMPERLWYVGHLAVVATDLGVSSWADMRAYLIHLAMHTNWCEISFQKLWLDVMQKLDWLDSEEKARQVQIAQLSPFEISTNYMNFRRHTHACGFERWRANVARGYLDDEAMNMGNRRQVT